MPVINKIKEYAKSINFVVDETSYDSKTRLITITCPNNHTTTVNYKNWKTNVNKCQKCPKKVTEKQTITVEYLKQLFSEKGFELLTDNFKNHDEKLKYKCKCGQINYAHLCNFKKMTYGCNVCSVKHAGKKMLLPFEEVVKSFEDRDYKILITETEYIGTDNLIPYKCNNGHLNEIKLSSLRSGAGCSICSGNKKLTYEQVKEKFQENGYKMISTTYVNARTAMEVECKNGHIIKICYDDVTHSQGNSKGCIYCAGSARCTYEDVKKAFENEKYVLLSKEYINAHKHLEFICPIGHHHKMSYTHFVSGKRCGICMDSKSETIIRKHLEKLNLKFVPEMRFEQCKNKTYLPFDFYVNDQFIIEFDGEQHFKPIDFFGGEESFKKRQLHDKIKTDFCFDYHIPLLRISYDCIDQIPQLIDNFIKQIKKDKNALKFSNCELYEYLEHN